MIDSSRIDALTRATVFDNDGDKIGSVGQVYIDPSTGSAAWLTVKTGLFGTGESFVPATDASYEGDDVRVGYSKDFVKDAPRVDADAELDQNDTDALYDYYDFGSISNVGNAAGNPVGSSVGSDAGTAGTVGHDNSGPSTDDAMTRSEEHLSVGTERVETGRARLHKYVVTEQETVTVPVSHEEVRVVSEPITDGNVGDALDGPEISEEDHEVVLTGDRVVAETEAVPVERVRLDTTTVTDQETVSGDVRKERIELDGEQPGTAGTAGTAGTTGTAPRI